MRRRARLPPRARLPAANWLALKQKIRVCRLESLGGKRGLCAGCSRPDASARRADGYGTNAAPLTNV